MPQESPSPIMRRLVTYLMEVEDENLRALVAELVDIKRQYIHNRNRPTQQYKEKVDAYARLLDE